MTQTGCGDVICFFGSLTSLVGKPATVVMDNLLCFSLQKLDIDGLPSNKYKDKLLKNTNFKQLEEEGALNERHANGIPLLTKLNPKLTINYHHIKRICSENNDYKCCRDINYYLDLIRAFIEVSISSNEYKEALKLLVKEAWEDRLGKDGYNCKMEPDDESIRKRCVLKQLHDYCDDKHFIMGKEEEYYKHLEEKWGSIISFTTSTKDNLHFKIMGWKNNQTFNYKNFLLTPKDICTDNYKNIELSHISLFKEELANEVRVAGEVRDGYQDRTRGESKQQVALAGPGEYGSFSSDLGDTTHHHPAPQSEHEGGAEEPAEAQLGAPLWETPLSAGFSVAGAVIFFFFLYKFSPVGSWIITRIKKNPGGAMDMNEDESFLFLNNLKHNDQYISYNSISH
ncbi:PIR Superfamily Protein [Plasmodium ovale curtisi]|uniref:PIR Superfamily Protein n=1 Tax=Plasmodium ovale curtisi TaxID=864141 RepID=A0A1A8XAT8_PLAOA|nr:PIR Superfamily Protein [Plasmodium ovale curtisi]